MNHGEAASDALQASGAEPVAYIGKLLVYMTSYDSREHLRALQTCWPPLWKKFDLFLGARLLVYLDENPAQMKNTALAEWHAAASYLAGGKVEVAPDGQHHGYTRGAMYGMYAPLEQNWFDGYDWVIRINPDVYPLDLAPLCALMTLPHADVQAVLANCWCNPKSWGVWNSLNAHTDFLPCGQST